MPFLFIGASLLVISIILLRKAIKSGNKEAVVGLNALILVAAILILFYGLFYSIAIP